MRAGLGGEEVGVRGSECNEGECIAGDISGAGGHGRVGRVGAKGDLLTGTTILVGDSGTGGNGGLSGGVCKSYSVVVSDEIPLCSPLGSRSAKKDIDPFRASWGVRTTVAPDPNVPHLGVASESRGPAN